MTRESRITVWVVILIAFGFVISLLSDILLPFVLGLAIAYLLDPMVDRLDKMGLPRAAAASIILVGFFVIVIALIAALVPLLEQQLSALARRLPALVEAIQSRIAPYMESVRAHLSPGQIEDLKGAATGHFGTVIGALKKVVGSVWQGGMALFDVFSVMLVTPIVAFYLVLQWHKIVTTVDDLFPREQLHIIREQLAEIDRTISGFVRGQGTVCLVLAVYYAVGLSLVGLESALVVGLGAGLISFVPYVGAMVGIVTALGLSWVQFGGDVVPMMMVAGVFFAGQLAESYVLVPRLVGGSVGLHDVWIIFALMAGGTLFGFIGVLLAIPVAAIIGVMVRFGLSQYRDSALYTGNADRADTPTPNE